MNDLSDSSDQNAIPPAKSSVTPTVAVPSFAKESEPGAISTEGLRDATGQEAAVPKEVLTAGVKVRPTTIPIPQSVAQMGVKPSGHNIPVQTTTTVVLPLTDDQIVVGLHQNFANSWRWLAEWCVRRLKQVHIAVKTVHGTLIREKA